MNTAWRRFIVSGIAVAAVLALGPKHLRAADASPALTLDQKEEFLRKAKVMKEHSVAKGITDTVRVTLSDGQITHDASVQRIDEHKTVFRPDNGPPEFNFKDTYASNIAGWKLARLLGLDDMVPPSVARGYEGKSAAFTWWIDDVMMDGVEKLNKKAEPPNLNDWNKELNVMYVFDQLIYNTDRNQTNVLIDKQWRLWMIDHTRAFRVNRNLLDPKVLSGCDRTLLIKLKGLDEATLKTRLVPYVSPDEIRALLARRDLIVKVFDAKGESALFDRPSRH